MIKHYCNLCNMGFDCAGDLEGHMKAHIIGDVMDNDHARPSFEIKSQLSNNKNKTHSYVLRARVSRPLMEFQECDDLENINYKKLSSSSSVVKFPASNEEEDLANCLLMMSKKSYASTKNEENNKAKDDENGIFQCKACKKVFNSHQALGGHRASHKKVKGCFAAKINSQENIDREWVQDEDHDHFTKPLDQPEATVKAPKMHECSVCNRVFTSGQALGGHKRCHWLTSSSDNAFIPNQYNHAQQLYKKPMLQMPVVGNYSNQINLNLNLTESVIAHVNNTKNEKMPSKEKAACEVKLRDLIDENLDGGWLKMGMTSTSAI